MTTYQIITTILSILSILGVGTVLTTLWKEKHAERLKKKEEQSEEHIQAVKKRNEEEYRVVLQAELQPIKESIQATEQHISEVKEDLKCNTVGTVTLLRDRMKCSLEYCKRRGYTTSTDLANWHELFNTYKSLGGNHFKEYVNAWKDEMESLPCEKEKRK